MAWQLVAADSLVEEKRVTRIDPATGLGKIYVFRRTVITEEYEQCRVTNSPESWSTTVTLRGDEGSQRYVRHGYRYSPLTGGMVETRTFVKPGKWKRVAVYNIEAESEEEE